MDEENKANGPRAEYCRQHGLEYRVVPASRMLGFPAPPPMPSAGNRKKVVVTGCYDWFHSGHVRFFEEVSAYGDLYVVIGHDANIRLLKGEGHPLFPEDERRYIVGSIRYVKHALISSGERLVGCRPGNPAAQARHLRGQRGRRSGRQTRILHEDGSGIPRAPAHPGARAAAAQKHGLARLLICGNPLDEIPHGRK